MRAHKARLNRGKSAAANLERVTYAHRHGTSKKGPLPVLSHADESASVCSPFGKIWETYHASGDLHCGGKKGPEFDPWQADKVPLFSQPGISRLNPGGRGVSQVPLRATISDLVDPDRCH